MSLPLTLTLTDEGQLALRAVGVVYSDADPHMHAALRRFRAAIDAALSNLEAGPLIRAHSTAAKPDAENDPGRPWSEISDSGLLWLINTTVFHPRGYALAIHFDSDGVATGWSIMGDGLERWAFAQFGWPEGRGPDDAFLKIRALLP